VIDKVRALDPLVVIRGNHDKASCGLDDGSQFNQVARLAAGWTGQFLTPFNRTYLRELPMGPVQIDALVEICHGAPFDEDYYIFDGNDAMRGIETATRPLCFFGHTHLPVMFWLKNKAFEGAAPSGPETVLKIEENVRYLVNPGSVGQPRDGDPRAAYAILDDVTRELKLRRIVYPVEKAQRRILAAGLPASLANRLALGR
jgi:diadenosine tetraphosphatase ApaH/serine/threonine PP2A family protein phosphatase